MGVAWILVREADAGLGGLTDFTFSEKLRFEDQVAHQSTPAS